MFGKKKSDKILYGIIGLGRFGYALAESLAEAGADLLVIDRDEEKIRQARDFTENAMIVNFMDKKALIATGIGNCDIAIVCIGSHMDVSILTTLNLLNMNIPHVIAKATSREHGEILARLGAEVVYPERDMAVRLASRLENSHVIDSMELTEQITISKLHLPKKMVGMSVVDSNLRSQFGLNIIAIEHHHEVMEYIQPDYIFQENDILIMTGKKEGLHKLNEWLED